MFDTKQSVLYELEGYDQWVIWEIEGGKKVPLNPKNGFNASPTNPATWASYESTRAAFEEHGYEGVGFVFTEDDPFCGIDLDGCIDPDTGEIADWASEIIDALDTYTEISPSGTGLHLFIRGSKPGTTCRRGKIEIYDKHRFLTITGRSLTDKPVEERQIELDDLYERVFGNASHRESREIDSKEHEHSGGGDTLSDNELLSKARASKTGGKFTRLFDHGDCNGYKSASEADQALAGYLAFWTGKDADRIETLMRRSQLQRNKWTENRDYLSKTITKAVENCNAVYDPKSYRKEAASTVNFKLQQLGQWRLECSWKGRSGPTDRDVYYALLSIAEKYGRDHKDGVTVSASIRDLALEASIGQEKTVRNSLKRLHEHSWVRTQKSGGARQATVFLLACDSQVDSKVPHTYCVDNYGVGLSQMIRNPSRTISTIGKRNYQILEFVHSKKKPVTLEEIADHLGTRKNNLKKRNIPTLLTEPAFLIETEEGYITPADVVERLEEHMEEGGQNEQYRIQYEKYEMQRKQFHNKEVTLKEAERMADKENRQRIERDMHHHCVHPYTSRNEEEITDAVSFTSVTETAKKVGG